MTWTMVILGALGASLGSFLNVCTLRIPRRISVVSESSTCPNCGSRLSWTELIPLLSFFVQGRKCNNCQAVISWRYLLYELFGAAALVLLFVIFGLSAEYLEKASFALMMSVVVVIDWEFRVIPNRVLLVYVVIGIVLRSLMNISEFPEAMVAALFAPSILMFIRFAGNRIFGRATMGWGDIELVAVIGFWVGIPLFLISLWLAALAGSVYGLTSKQARLAGVVPFGTMLAISSSLVFIFDDFLLGFIHQWIAAS